MCMLRVWAAAELLLLVIMLSSTARGQSAPALDKVVLRPLDVGANCSRALHDKALRDQLKAAIPADVLEAQGAAFEDPKDYMQIAEMEAPDGDVLKLSNVLGLLTRLKITTMLTLSVSCTRDARKPATVSLQRMNVSDAAKYLKACTQVGGNGPVICNAARHIFENAGYTTVQVNDDDLPGAFVRAFERVFFAPHLSFGNADTKVDPGEMVSIPFLVVANDGSNSKRSYKGPRVSNRRRYVVTQDVVELPHDVADKVCAEPEEYWDEIACGAAFSQSACDRADAVEFKATSLVHRRTTVMSGEERGGNRLEFRVAGYPTRYLVRAQAVAKGEAGRTPITSSAIYRCIEVRFRPYYIVASVRLGFPHDLARLAGSREIYPGAGLTKPAMSIDVGFLKQFTPTLAYLPAFPSSKLGAAVGLTVVQGTFPCASGHVGNCGPSGRHPGHLSLSMAGDIKFSFDTHVFVWKRLTAKLFGDIGFGIERLRSNPSFSNDGVHFVLVSGVGAGVGFLWPRFTSLATESTLGVMYQVRARLPQVLTAVGTGLDAAGVPDTLGVAWVTLNTHWGPNW